HPREEFFRSAVAYRRCPRALSPGWELLHDADLGAAILRPGFFIRGGIGWHLGAKADGLDVLGVGAHGDQGLADGLRTALPETAIVFRRAAFIGEAGDNDL